MKLTNTLRTLAIAAPLAASALVAVPAQAEVSANVALTTDYVFRGSSQTDEQPAIQGGFDYSHESGFYAGVWGSNVDSGFYAGSELEADLYAGFSGEIGDIGYDFGYIGYNYPGSNPKLDYDELYLGASYMFLSATYSMGVDFGNTDIGDYFDVSADFELPEGFGIGLHVGSWMAENNGQDFIDYKLGVSKEFSGLGFELAYTDTDMNAAECSGFGATAGACDGRVTFTVSKEM